MSSFILSHDSHLMMLEIAVENVSDFLHANMILIHDLYYIVYTKIL